MTSSVEFPLVTFVLFTYNQEPYIEDAVQSALAQDYPYLKIIISDDCSNDNTLKLAKKIVKEYSGKHLVVCRSNSSNLGVMGHLNYAMSKIDTELVVLAAGDDISFPHRVSRIVDTYFSYGRPKLLFSKAFKIDVAGNLLEGFAPDNVIPLRDINAIIKSLDSVEIRFGLYLGATEAWSMTLWQKYGPILDRDCYEDIVMGFRAALEGSYKYIDEPLIKYRVNVGISSVSSQSLKEKLALRKYRINLKRALASQRREDLQQSSGRHLSEYNNKIARQILEHTIRFSYYESPVKVYESFTSKPMLTVILGVSEVKYLLKRFIKLGLRYLMGKIQRA
jgi:glycosyltransferase involved in cell wall biosynthesis